MTDRLVQYTANANKFVSNTLSDTSMLNEQEIDLLNFSLNKEWANPKFKLKWFVGQTQITPFSKLRQWLLEVRTREEALENLEYEIEKYEIKIERYKYDAEHANDEFDRRENLLEASKMEKDQIKSKRRLQNWYLERQQILDLIKEFLDSEEAYLPDGSGRTYMDIMGTDEEDIYEAEYWTNRLAKQAATDLLFYGRIGTGNMDAILSMDPKQQNDTLCLSVSYATQLQKTQDTIQLEVSQNLGLENMLANESSLTIPKLDINTTEEPDQKIKFDSEDILNVYSS